MKQKLIVIGGPTASGKTALSVELAKRINGEIISADSMQCYKYMDIGTAKVTHDEMQGIKHYGIDVLEPSEDFNITYFKNMADNAMKEIWASGKTPILAGGTGFYIQSVIFDTTFTDEEDDDSIRNELQLYANENGAEALHKMLEDIDPESAEAIHANNVKRVIRAIEYYKKNNEKISDHNKRELAKESPYDYRYFAITDNRDDLYKRIDRRVDIMMENGLVDEVKWLINHGLNDNTTAMQGIGYKEIVMYLNNQISLEEATDMIKQGSRRYAKRQLTWLRGVKDVIWVDRSELKNNEAMLQFMLDRI